MEIEQVRKALSYVMIGLFSMLLLLLLFGFVAVEMTKKPQQEINEIVAQNRKALLFAIEGKPINSNFPDPWPPNMNQTYPEIALIDNTGKEFNLSELKGKVLIVEYVDMMSPISQAQSGARIVGSYAGGEVDSLTEEVADVIKRETQGKFMLPDENVVHVKIIIYGENGGQASRDDAQNWAEHFKFSAETNNVVVAVPVKNLTSEITDKVIGGYQLVDRNYFLRVDSAGPEPKHNLQLTFAPMVAKLIR